MNTNLLKNILMRVSGEWPMIGPPPLTEDEYKEIWKDRPAFVDYFAIADYDTDEDVFIFDDGVNVGLAYQVNPANIEGKSENAYKHFNDSLTLALNQLPSYDDSSCPYIIQLYLVNEEVDNLGNIVCSSIEDHKRTKLSDTVCSSMRTHSDMLTHPKGVFKDSRIDREKGWRVNDRKIYMCVYRKYSEKEAQKNEKLYKKSLAEITKQDIKPFITALSSLGISCRTLKCHELINWLGSFFGGREFDKYTKEQIKDMQKLASFDVGQCIFKVPPKYPYHDTKNDHEKGIYQFGKQYYRYLTTEGISSVPKDGVITSTLADFDDGKDIASVWESMPPSSMMTWTVIPIHSVQIERKIQGMLMKSQDRKSKEAQMAFSQADLAQTEIMNGQLIYYFQVGCYIADQDLNKIALDLMLDVRNTLATTKCINILAPEYDLISQCSFVRNLPFCYDYKHDKKAALRSRMTYTGHIASTLPFYGAFKGSENPCYLFYNRSGQPVYINPFHPDDHERVAHEVIFGPTGSGKSATMVYMTLMSLAVNHPRMFILDKGNSFKLMADFCEEQGLKVKRIAFHQASKDIIAPFVETKKALKEAEGVLDNDDDDEEKRSYLSEMMNILVIMVTGGRDEEFKALKQSDKAALQTALIDALRNSEKANKPHAIVSDIVDAMMTISENEKLAPLALKQREMADSLKLWTQGLAGRLFNQYGEGFSPDYDLNVIEFGNLTAKGSEALFAVAGLSVLNNITAFAESEQNTGRQTEVVLDEGHYWMKSSLLIAGMIEGTKVWRKLGTWLKFATQDFDDIKDDAKKILSQAEFWWLLNMDHNQIEQLSEFKSLSDEQKYLIKKAKKEKGRFTEAVLLSEKFNEALFRLVPPSLILALAQTDNKEKEMRQKLMDKYDCTELQAAYKIADEIQESRESYKNN